MRVTQVPIRRMTIRRTAIGSSTTMMTIGRLRPMNAKVTLTQRGMQPQPQPLPPTQEQIDATNAQFQDALESGTRAIKLRKQWSQSILLRGNAAGNFYAKLG